MWKVSIIITTYKRPTFLKRAIISALNQTYKNIEVVVVDDNNENSNYRKETENMILQFQDKVKYIKHSENKGACHARNTGILYSTGELFSFLDDDDEMYPEHIQKLLEKYLELDNAKIGVMFSQLEIIDKNNKVIGTTNKIVKESINPLEYHLTVGVNSTSTLLITKKALIAVNNWIQIPSGQEDYLLTRIFAKGFLCYSIPDITIKIYYHELERISIGQSKINGLDNLFDLKKKYFNLVSRKVQKKVEYNYFMSKAINYRKEDIRKSMYFYIKSVEKSMFNKKNISTLLVLLLGINNYNKIKHFIVKGKK